MFLVSILLVVSSSGTIKTKVSCLKFESKLSRDFFAFAEIPVFYGGILLRIQTFEDKPVHSQLKIKQMTLSYSSSIKLSNDIDLQLIMNYCCLRIVNFNLCLSVFQYGISKDGTRTIKVT